jgi:hypothetical protein
MKPSAFPATFNSVVWTDGTVIETAEADGSMSIKVNEPVKVIGSMLFPVGSLYCTNSTANPSSLSGFGTRSRIAERFLRSSASRAAGRVTGGGGAASMPSHTRSFDSGIPAPRAQPGPYQAIVPRDTRDSTTHGRIGNSIENSRGIKVVPCTEITDGGGDSQCMIRLKRSRN